MNYNSVSLLLQRASRALLQSHPRDKVTLHKGEHMHTLDKFVCTDSFLKAFQPVLFVSVFPECLETVRQEQSFQLA